MYLREVVIDGLASRARAIPPEGPGFSESEVAGAERLEIWATEATDEGEDFVEFRLMHRDRAIIRRIRGY